MYTYTYYTVHTYTCTFIFMCIYVYIYVYVYRYITLRAHVCVVCDDVTCARTHPPGIKKIITKNLNEIVVLFAMKVVCSSSGIL